MTKPLLGGDERCVWGSLVTVSSASVRRGAGVYPEGRMSVPVGAELCTPRGAPEDGWGRLRVPVGAHLRSAEAAPSTPTVSSDSRRDRRSSPVTLAARDPSYRTMTSSMPLQRGVL